jgi:type I restriction enzyme M protein
VLDTETKRRIDTARDILVGKVPDPKSQVEQITIALIYKFMDDMDAESEELGGERTFFAGDFARYGWAKLMRSGLGGHETLNLYAEAIQRMPENPGIPALFREIFKNAYLPYRDPETLRAFLKVIDEFEYDHSERLGDAFEYLLSVLGSQGDAGQFRTPRHIIDFIVAIIDPKKDETVLDPACGTAGFLISSYKHIVEANADAEGHSTLTPDERERLAQNFRGYDISPDMVRLSLVNLYLHGFSEPHIYEYDTLTSEERWNEYFDVILANPPFMSPKGGIRPHNRFSVKSKRSEVLFVDYIAEHLTAEGRAGIIVPEGIIFQSQTAYKALRKMLVESALVAVISLPAGVFNPYSGVKTSILILDKALARQSDTIGFFKVENDGFSLGAQRREIAQNDLPQVKAEVEAYLQSLRSHGEPRDLQLTHGLIVAKEKIAGNDDYNLSGERYRDSSSVNHSFPLVSLNDENLFRIESGGTPKSDVPEYWNGGIPWITLVDLPATDFVTQIRSTQRTISERGLKESSARIIPENSVIVSTRATIGRIGINRTALATNQGFKNIVIEDESRVVPEYVALALTHLRPVMEAWATGGTFKELSKSKFGELRIPLPPLEVQKEIVAEIEGYQKVIDGARAVVENYRPHIPIDPEWPVVKLTEVVREGPRNGYSGKPVDYPTNLRVLSLSATTSGTLDPSKFKYLDEEIPEDSPFRCQNGDIYLQRGNTKDLVGTAAMFNVDCCNFIYPDLMIRVRADETEILSQYLLYTLQSESVREYLKRSAVGSAGNMPKINQNIVANIPVPLPPLEVQEQIIGEIDAEQAIINANRELIERFEKKVQMAINKVWGEADKVPTGV